MQTGFLYHKLKHDLIEISRRNFCWISLNKFLQVLKDLNCFDLLSQNTSNLYQNKKPYLYLFNKYIFDEFYQNNLIDENEEMELSSLESASKIDETSRENAEESNSEFGSEPSLSHLEQFDGNKKGDLLNFFNQNVNRAESIKPNFDNNQEKTMQNEKKTEGFILNQKKRSNILLSPTQNYVNLAYEKASETKDTMKQSMIYSPSLASPDKNEMELENFMEKLEEDFKNLKLSREDILQLPFEIMKEYIRTTSFSFDKAKENLIKTVFNNRNHVLFYNKTIFPEKTGGEVHIFIKINPNFINFFFSFNKKSSDSESDFGEKFFIFLTQEKRPQIFKVLLKKINKI